MRQVLNKVRNVTRRVRAIYSPRVASKVRWYEEAAEWNERGVPTRILRNAVLVAETGSVYFPVAKAANSSMRAMIAGDSAWQPIITAGITLNDIALGKIPTFTVVRHPVERFWSAYADKIVRKIKEPDAKLVIQVRDALGLSTTDTIRPEQMLDFLESQSFSAMDQHFLPQWYCTGIRHLPISFIGRVENLSADIAELVQRNLLPPRVSTFPHLNRSEGKSLIDPKLQQRVVSFYEQDFATFGYDV